MAARHRGVRPRWAAALLAAAVLGCAGGPRPSARGETALEATAPARRAERLLLIAIPGLAPAHYLPPAGAPPLARQIAALAEAGVAVESLHPVFPPATLPSLVSLVTGRTPAGHGALSLRPVGDDGVGPPQPFPASAVQGETLWQAVSRAGGAAVAFDWPGTDGSPAAQAAVGAPAEPGAARDAALVDAACALLAGPSPPRLLGVVLAQAAVARAAAPPGSRGVEAAIVAADAEVGRLVACLRRAQRLATTAVVVAGDHGVLPAHTAVRPNVVLSEVGLVTADGGGRVLSWSALARSNGGSAFVYAREDEDALLARRALDEAARASGAFHVVSAQEMLARGADPQAWFGLDAAPGWVFEDGVKGPAYAPASQRSAGGYAPGEPRMATGLVAWGAGLRDAVRIPELRQIDVAPTLARLLDVRLEGAEGRALAGVLQP